MGLLEILIEENVFADLLLTKNFRAIHRILDELLSSGKISSRDYDELMLELARLIAAKGEEYEEKAKMLAKKIRECILKNHWKNDILASLKRGEYHVVHRILDELLSSGKISSRDYDELMLELARLIAAKGEEYEEKAKMLAKKMERYIR